MTDNNQGRSGQSSKRDVPYTLQGWTTDEQIQRMYGLQQSARPAYADVALAFANALAAGDFDSAHQMLTPELREEFPPARLGTHYEAMIEYAGETTVTDVEVLSTLDNLPHKEPADIGWAYVSISGQDDEGGAWGEAVSVILADRDGQSLIRFIEWGRP